MKITKRSDRNLYQTSVKLPNGKYKRVYGKTKREVREKAESLFFDIRSGKFVENNNIPMSEWCKEWCENYLINITESSRKTYITILNKHIIPYFGEKKLRNITHNNIQQFINSRHNLSPKYIKNIHLVLHRCLRDAKTNGFIAVNPADNILLPKLEHKEMNILNENEIKDFLEVAYLTEPDYADCFEFMLMTGLRVGEFSGLPIDAYEPRTHTLLIKQQYNRRLGKITPPKHDKVRSIVLSKRSEEIIQKRIVEVKNVHPRINRYNLIFLTPRMTIMNDNTLRDVFKRIVGKINKPDLRIHDLRHTYTTIALESGVDLKTLSQNLGHTSPSFTLNKYSHSTFNMQKDSAEKIDNFFENLPQNYPSD